VAIDASGNIIIADQGVPPRIFRQSPAGGAPTAIFTGAPYSEPRGVAIDASGNIIVTDFGTPPGVYRQSPAGGPPTPIFAGAPYVTPVGVAVVPSMPFDFWLSASPPDVTVLRGGTASYTVTVALITGTAQPVTLTVSGLPLGASAIFNPSTVTPPGTSSLQVSTSSSTPAGNYLITVTGSGGGQTHSTTFMLQVLTPAEAAKNLIDLVRTMSLPNGLTQSLNAKLQAALNSMISGQSKAAKNQLRAFINEIQAQTGKEITGAQAAQLIAAANDIINALP